MRLLRTKTGSSLMIGLVLVSLAPAAPALAAPFLTAPQHRPTVVQGKYSTLSELSRSYRKQGLSLRQEAKQVERAGGQGAGGRDPQKLRGEADKYLKYATTARVVADVNRQANKPRSKTAAEGTKLGGRLPSRKVWARFVGAALENKTSVEMEMNTNKTIWDGVTTKDGTIGPLVRAWRGDPKKFYQSDAAAFLRRIAAAKGVKPSQLRWDHDLKSGSIDHRETLLGLLVKDLSKNDFYRDRQVKGLQTKEVLSKPEGKALSLAGLKYAKDSAKVQVGDFLRRKVEFKSESSKEKGFELHTRFAGLASKTLKDTFKLGTLFNSNMNYAHQHIPVRLAKKDPLVNGNRFAIFRFVDFVRRTNTYLELQDAANGYPLTPNGSNGTVSFDYMKAANLGKLNDHFFAISDARQGTLNHPTMRRMADGAMKMQAVGVRTGSLYSGMKDTNGIGLEIRSLDKASTVALRNPGNPQGKERFLERRGEFVNAVQIGMYTHYYGTPKAAQKKWYDRAMSSFKTPRNVGHTPDDARKQGMILADLHYNKDLATPERTAPKALREDKELDWKVLNKKIPEMAKISNVVKMLAHSWEKDPVLAGDPAARQRVLVAQKAALMKVQTGVATPFTVISIGREFVRSSKLREAFGNSLGMASYARAN